MLVAEQTWDTYLSQENKLTNVSLRTSNYYIKSFAASTTTTLDKYLKECEKELGNVY